jgi:hypothetical protein
VQVAPPRGDASTHTGGGCPALDSFFGSRDARDQRGVPGMRTDHAPDRREPAVAWMVIKWWLGRVEEFAAMEEYFRHDDPDALVARYDEAIEVLEHSDVAGWMDLARNAGLGDEAIARFYDHWMPGNALPGVGTDAMVERVQEGFLAAMRDARDRALPYSIVWVTPPRADDDFFDIGHVVGANAVTVVIASNAPQAVLDAS